MVRMSSSREFGSGEAGPHIGAYLQPVWALVVSFVAFSSSVIVGGVADRCRGQVKAECGLRRSAHGHTRRLCVRAVARLCEVFILALGVVRSL